MKWLLLSHERLQNDTAEEENLTVRLATIEDLQFLKSIYDKKEGGSHVLAQDLMFWDTLGFRSLFIGCEPNENTPSVICYLIEWSDREKINNMPYGHMYSHLTKNTCQTEGLYVLKNKRGHNLAFKLCQVLHKQAYSKGIVSIYRHIPVNSSKIASFKSSYKQGYTPVQWITHVTIDLPIFRTMKKVFIRQEIKDTEWKSFPLSIFRSIE